MESPALHIVRTLRDGRFGTVYAALHDDRLVTLETADAASADPDLARAHFRHVQAAADAVDHPSFVRPIALVELGDGTPALVQEHIGGVALDTILDRRGALPADIVTAVFAALCAHLAAVHRAGYVHRNLQPSDLVLVHAGRSGEIAVRVRNLDLVERAERGGPAFTGAPAVDVYLVGGLAWWALSGRRFEADPRQVLGRLPGPRPDLAAAIPGIDPALALLVSSMLNPRLGDRPRADAAAAAWRALGRGHADAPDELPLTAPVTAASGFHVAPPRAPEPTGQVLMHHARHGSGAPLSAVLRGPQRAKPRRLQTRDLEALRTLVQGLADSFHPTRRREYARQLAQIAQRIGASTLATTARSLLALPQEALEAADAAVAAVSAHLESLAAQRAST